MITDLVYMNIWSHLDLKIIYLNIIIFHKNKLLLFLYLSTPNTEKYGHPEKDNSEK